MPKVSVIIPTHSRPHMLARAVESARAAGTDVEIIVVDDASTDETAAVCRQMEGIEYIRLERNQGVAGARNVGILASTSEYVAFLDDDDLRLPSTLDAQLEVLEADRNVGFVCGAIEMADQQYHPTGEVSLPRAPGGDVFWELLELDFPVMPLAVVVRKECFVRVGLLDSHLSGIDDWDIFVRIAELYPVALMNEVVGLYRQPSPFSGQGSSGQAAQLYRAARHQRRLLRLPRAMAATAQKRREVRRRTLNRIADTLLWNAARRLPERAYGFAWANALVALRLSPLRAARPGAYRKLMHWMASSRAGY
jgi:glycosyltransferase involved in cell wall biosynthesis